MVKPEWGKKRICPSCGLKYYDFNNSPITCPSCKTEFDPDLYLRSRKGKTLSTKSVPENNEDISNLDDAEVDDEEVVSDDDPILDLNKENKDNDNEVEIDIDNNVTFIEEDDITDEGEISVEISEDDKE